MSEYFGHLLVRGTLRDLGYSIHLPERERREILKKAVKRYGGLSVFRKLNAVATLQKRTNPTIARKFKRDAEWVKRMFYGTPEWESKKVIPTRVREKLARKRMLDIKTLKKLKILDPNPEMKTTGLRIAKGYLYSKDYEGEGLIRVNVFEDGEFPEFAIYIPKKVAKPDYHDWRTLLKNAGFVEEEVDYKYVIRGEKYNLFVYFV